MTSRAERVEQILQLRAEGADTKETAQRLGLKPGTVRNYLADPDGAKAAAHKRRNATKCEVCGEPTSAAPGEGPARCSLHRRSRGQTWTRERIIEAIQAWALTFGDPPSFADWSPHAASRLKSPEGEAKAARYERLHSVVPVSTTVVNRFGSFNAGIEAAGFKGRPRGIHASKSERPPKTHCVNGHRMTKANVYIWKGRRHCRTCRADREKAASARRAADRRGLLTTRRA